MIISRINIYFTVCFGKLHGSAASLNDYHRSLAGMVDPVICLLVLIIYGLHHTEERVKIVMALGQN